MFCNYVVSPICRRFHDPCVTFDGSFKEKNLAKVSKTSLPEWEFPHLILTGINNLFLALQLHFSCSFPSKSAPYPILGLSSRISLQRLFLVGEREIFENV